MQLTMPAARINAGYTQKTIAEKLGISREYYNDLENGRVDMKPVYVYGFCQVTGINPDELILPQRTTKRRLETDDE